MRIAIRLELPSGQAPDARLDEFKRRVNSEFERHPNNHVWQKAPVGTAQAGEAWGWALGDFEDLSEGTVYLARLLQALSIAAASLVAAAGDTPGAARAPRLVLELHDTAEVAAPPRKTIARALPLSNAQIHALAEEVAAELKKAQS